MKINCILRILSVAIAACLFAIFTPILLSARDLFSYWVGARLLREGQNPYDSALHLEYWAKYTNSSEVLNAAPLYSPPFVLALLSPLSLLPSYRIAYVLWVTLSVSLYLILFLHLVKSHELRASAQFKAVLLLLTFPPVLLICVTGQVLLIPFVGLVGWIYLYKSHPSLAGASAVLTLCKPHIFLLLYLIQLIAKPPAHFMRSGVFGTLILLILPLAMNENVYGQFFDSFSGSSGSWLTPTIGAFIQGWWNSDLPALRFIPLGIICVAIVKGACLCEKIDFVKYGIPLSLIAAPYLWSYDFILLLPTLAVIINESCRRRELRWVIWALLVMNVLLLLSSSPNYLSVWYPVGVLGVSFVIDQIKEDRSIRPACP